MAGDMLSQFIDDEDVDSKRDTSQWLIQLAYDE